MHGTTITATPSRITVGASWFGEVITRVEDANTYGHYPNRVRVTTDNVRAYNITLGARYAAATVAIV